MRAGALLLLCLGTGCATARGVEVIDMASEFLETACKAAPGEAFGRAWIAYEDRHAAYFRAIYYRDDQALRERAALASELGARRDEMCGHTRMFLAVAPGVASAVGPRVAALVGVTPRSPLVFAAALQWTDGRVEDFEGREVIALNARHDSFERTRGVTVTMTHELIHAAIAAGPGKDDHALPPAARSLYREGAAVFGVQTLLPEIAERAYGLRPEQLAGVERAAPRAARALLDVLGDPRGGDPDARFFSGASERGSDLPPKMGYVLGARVFHAIAAKRGAEAAIRTPPAAFLDKAKLELAKIAAAPGSVPPSTVEIRLQAGTPGEAAAKRQLEALLDRNELAPWTFTRTVVIDETCIPHSHPVLTLHTRHAKDDLLLLSTYIHENAHWYVQLHAAATSSAVRELEKRYPKLPVGFPDGAETLRSSYEHLLVIAIEHSGLIALRGELEADQAMVFWSHDHYRHLYRLELEDRRPIMAVLEKHLPWPPK